MPPAEVAFNDLPLRSGGAGVSTYIRELLAGLVPLIAGGLVASVSAESVSELPQGVEARSRPPARGLRRALQGMAGPPEARLFHGLDVDLPLRSGAPTVATVHDMAVFDVPWAFDNSRVVAERLIVAQALRRADVIIAVSDFTAERVERLLGRRAHVIPEAAPSHLAPPSPEEVERVRGVYGLPDSFVLHVGTIEPRKNVRSLAVACAAVGIPLVAVGASGWQTHAPPGVMVTGFVPSQDLPGLYGAATVAAYASAYEGFGLPPLEAMACGCPVVSTPVPVLELVPSVALQARSGRPDDLEVAIRELSGDHEQRMARAALGVRAARGLSWAKAARSTALIYRGLGVRVAPEVAAEASADDGPWRRPVRTGIYRTVRALVAPALVGESGEEDR